MFDAILGDIIGGALAGVIALVIQDWSLRRRLYSLEYDHAVLEERVNSEQKKRAAITRHQSTERDILDKINANGTGTVAAQPQPWYLPFVGKKN